VPIVHEILLGEIVELLASEKHSTVLYGKHTCLIEIALTEFIP